MKRCATGILLGFLLLGVAGRAGAGPGLVIRFRIVDLETGAPLAGAAVHGFRVYEIEGASIERRFLIPFGDAESDAESAWDLPFEKSWLGRRSVIPLGDARSDPDGACNFPLDDLRGEGTCEFHVEADRRRPTMFAVRITAQASGTHLVTVPLGPGIDFEGRVVDAAGKAVAGARIMARRPHPAGGDEAPAGERFLQFAVAGEDGRFRSSGGCPGAYTLQVSSGGCGGGLQSVRVVGEDDPVEISLWAPREIRGRVVDESDHPVHETPVCLRAPNGWTATVLSGPDGSFCATDAPPGELGAWFGASYGDISADQDGDVELTASSWGPEEEGAQVQVRGRVLDASGQPAIGATVMVVRDDEGDGECLGGMIPLTVVELATRLDGGFETRMSVKPHSWIGVIALHDALGWGRAPMDAVADCPDGIEVTIRLAGPTHWVGRLLDRDGDAVAGASLFGDAEWARPWDTATPGRMCRTVTDREGRFFLPNVHPRPTVLWMPFGKRNRTVLRYLLAEPGTGVRRLELRLR